MQTGMLTLADPGDRYPVLPYHIISRAAILTRRLKAALCFCLVVLLLTGCTARTGSHPEASGAAQTIKLDEARQVLLAFSNAPSEEEAQRFTTGNERAFMQGIIDGHKAGSPGKAFAWRVEDDSPLALIEGNAQQAVVELTYVNSFSRKEQRMRFQFAKTDGRWLIANHTDSAGVWWTQPTGAALAVPGVGDACVHA